MCTFLPPLLITLLLTETPNCTVLVVAEQVANLSTVQQPKTSTDSGRQAHQEQRKEGRLGLASPRLPLSAVKAFCLPLIHAAVNVHDRA